MATPIPTNKATFAFDDLLRIAGGDVQQGGSRVPVTGVCTDSRRLQPGNLFVSLIGERFDAHDHVQEAVDAGATALVVSKDVDVRGDVAVVRVNDTLEALGRLGREWRRAWAREAKARGSSGTVVAVTGSAGKTTTCHVITTLLGAMREDGVHATAGNLNNAVGIPMVLLGLGPEHGQLVIEIGTNQPGEIAYGASLAEPDIAVVTLVACAHTLGLGSVQAVAAEKGALFASVPDGGICVANADDPLVMSQVGRAPSARLVTYGRSSTADVRIQDACPRGWNRQEIVMALRLGPREQIARVCVPLLGDAGAYATAASVATAVALSGDSIDWDRALCALNELPVGFGRLRATELPCGTVLIDDSYNANPASMRDSLTAASKAAHSHNRPLHLVLGEMRELGEHSEVEHRRVGTQVAEIRPASLVTVGAEAAVIAEEAKAAGLAVEHVLDSLLAVEPVLRAASGASVILVKGSRGTALEHVVRAIQSWGETRPK